MMPEAKCQDDAISKNEQGGEAAEQEETVVKNSSRAEGVDYLDHQVLGNFNGGRLNARPEKIESEARSAQVRTGGDEPGFYYQVPWECLPNHLRERHQSPSVFRWDPPTRSEPRLATSPLRQDSGQAAATAGSQPSNLKEVLELMVSTRADEAAGRDLAVTEGVNDHACCVPRPRRAGGSQC